MYEVHGGVRPGRPVLAIVASAALLAGTFSLAAWWSAVRERLLYGTMEPETRDYPALGLRLRLPAGWTPLADEFSLFPGCAMAWRSGRTPGEFLAVFQGWPRPMGVPSVECEEILTSLTARLTPGSHPRLEAAGLGGVWALQGESRPVPFRHGRHDSASTVLARAAMLHDGQLYGVLMYVPDRFGDHHRLLFEEVCRGLVPLDQEPVADPGELFVRAGISFAPPPGARFVRTGAEEAHLPGRLRLEGGEGDRRWYLDVARTALVGGRTIRELAADLAGTVLEDVGDPPAVEPFERRGRPVCRVRLDLYPGRTVGGMAWVVEIDNSTALLIVGRHEAGGEQILTEVAETIAGEARVTAMEHTLDLNAAVQRGRQCLAALAREGLNAVWGSRATQPEIYDVGSGGVDFHAVTRSLRSNVGDDGRIWWHIQQTGSTDDPLEEPALLPGEVWVIRDDQAAHERRTTFSRRDRSLVSYSERRTAGQQAIDCRLAVGTERTVHYRVWVDDGYAPEPVLVEAAGRVARDPARAAAIFTAVSPFVPHAYFQLVLPAGRGRLPGWRSSATAWRVCVLPDHSLRPMTLYYDDAGRLLAVSHDGRVWQRRSRADADPAFRPPRQGSRVFLPVEADRTRWAG